MTGEARAWRAVMGGSVRGPSAGFGGEGADDTCSWCEAELPLLRFSCSLADLRHVTLILAVFDRDIGSKDDPLGADRRCCSPERGEEGRFTPRPFTGTAMVPLSEPVERLLRAGGGAAGRSSGEASGEGPRRGEGCGGDSSGSGGALAEAPGGSIGAQSHSWPRSSARGAWGRCSTGGEGVGGRLEVSQPLVWKGTTRGTGQLSCSLTVGAGLSFVADAVQSGAGSRSSHLSNNVFLSVPLKLRALRALAPRKVGQPHTSPVSPPSLAYTSAASRPSLAHLSPISRPRPMPGQGAHADGLPPVAAAEPLLHASTRLARRLPPARRLVGRDCGVELVGRVHLWPHDGLVGEQADECERTARRLPLCRRRGAGGGGRAAPAARAAAVAMDIGPPHAVNRVSIHTALL